MGVSNVRLGPFKSEKNQAEGETEHLVHVTTEQSSGKQTKKQDFSPLLVCRTSRQITKKETKLIKLPSVYI